MSPTFVLLALTTFIQSSPRETFDAYLTALKANDLQKAASYWTDESIRESERLGITFTDIAPKYDNASPVVTHLAAIINGTARVNAGHMTITNRAIELDVAVIEGTDTLKTTYYLEGLGEDLKLSSPLFIMANDWKTKLTRYCEIHYRDSTLLNDYAIERLDQFIDSTCDKFGVTNERKANLRRIKIPYYLGDKNDVKVLTGFETFGMTNLQFDAVITQYLPHPHELTHLLIDYALQSQLLYTLPYLQEGLACHLGGRWGKSVGVIDQMGSYLLENEVVQLDSVLTWRGFYQSVGMSDLTYPVSSEFVGFLIEEAGFGKFLDIYQVESGRPEILMQLTAHQIRADIERVTGTDWKTLMQRFREYRKSYIYSGIEPGGVATGSAVQRLERGGDWAEIYDAGERYTIKAHLSKPDDFVVLLFNATDISQFKGYKSALFVEHLPKSSWNGEIVGLRFSSHEAGCYDYRTNCLEAKYVTAFNPSNVYWDGKEGIVTFRIRKELLGKPIENLEYRLR